MCTKYVPNYFCQKLIKNQGKEACLLNTDEDFLNISSFFNNFTIRNGESIPPPPTAFLLLRISIAAAARFSFAGGGVTSGDHRGSETSSVWNPADPLLPCNSSLKSSHNTSIPSSAPLRTSDPGELFRQPEFISD
ncbi:unnamed protein product [Cuscuta epithymum]|uniref:Uncharacterized protein n=1 Tax=Cuscuta epithymum TaxID=186058 RepID=A0AAV0EMH7_9ASTE|nr:unnamed protein product [Cuscuta epithymum]